MVFGLEFDPEAVWAPRERRPTVLKVACLQLDTSRQPLTPLLVNKNRTANWRKSGIIPRSVRFFAGADQAKDIVGLQNTRSGLLGGLSVSNGSSERYQNLNRKKVGWNVWNVLESSHLIVRLAPSTPTLPAPSAVVSPWRPRMENLNGGSR